MKIINRSVLVLKPTAKMQDWINNVGEESDPVSPEMAIRLSRLFGDTAEFWLNAQRAVDLWVASRTIKEKIKRISPLSAA